MNLFFVIVFAVLAISLADEMWSTSYDQVMAEKDKTLAMLNSTTGGPYTYDISSHHFTGTGFDGSYIDTSGACCGASGSCRNNPSCECQKNVGPLPAGTYTLGNMYTFKGMPYCYDLYPAASNSMCGRSGFLIHGGGCSSNPSEGCIVIEDQNIRYKIKSGATLHVVN